MRTASFLWLLAAAPILGCTKQASRHYVQRVDVVVPTSSDADALGMRSELIQSIFSEELKANGHFEVPKGDSLPASGARPTKFELELSPIHEGAIDGRPGNYCEIEASLLVRRREEDGWSNYEVNERAQERISGASLDERQAAAQRALRFALREAIAMADLQLAAIEKSDRKLVKELNAADPRLREAAIRVLSDRKNPAVRSALLEKLKGSEADGVRRAIGGLVELRDPQAVPALIELARGKDPSFLREILFALGSIGGEEAQAYLFTVSQGHDDPDIREAAKQALQELQSRIVSGDLRSDSGGSQRVQRNGP